MRKRTLALTGSVAVGLTLLTAVPAAAAHTVTIAFPGGNSEFYSPFAGPATVTFTIDPSDVDDTFAIRLRPTGGSVIHSESVFVNAEDPSGTKVVDFDWPALSVANATQYDVAVYRDGAAVAVQSFFLRPKLVRITDVSPDPFLPWIDDGYKDTTTVSFSLATDADAEARVFQATGTGKCCSTLVLSDTSGLSSLSAGANTWTWDGQGSGTYAGNLPKGEYYIRIWADDGALGSAISNPFKVTLARTYREKATKSKPARNFHHQGPSTATALGGGCLTYISVDNLVILCQSGKMSVYWRWGLGSDEKIVNQSFVLESSNEDCPRKIRSTSHTKHESAFTVNEDLADFRALCALSTAKITYSYLQAS
jgi:hypothetical protein